jgi:hypothetical protein
MRQLRPRRERTFAPLQEKTLANVLRHLFITEFGYGQKVVFAEVMIQRIFETLEPFLMPLPLLRPGQVLWMAVRRDRSKHTFESMKDTPKVPVVLDLIADEDLVALAAGETCVAIRRRRHARLLDQALVQGGVLAQSDLVALTLANDKQVYRDIQHVQKAEDRLLPYRGTVQDIGPTMSHKVDVARLLEAGYLEPEIGRKLSPVHDLRSVERYAQTYKNVLKLLDKDLAPEEIASILSLSLGLLQRYMEIVQEHHPEVLGKNSHLQGTVAVDSQVPPKGHKS